SCSCFHYSEFLLGVETISQGIRKLDIKAIGEGTFNLDNVSGPLANFAAALEDLAHVLEQRAPLPDQPPPLASTPVLLLNTPPFNRTRIPIDPKFSGQSHTSTKSSSS